MLLENEFDCLAKYEINLEMNFHRIEHCDRRKVMEAFP